MLASVFEVRSKGLGIAAMSSIDGFMACRTFATAGGTSRVDPGRRERSAAGSGGHDHCPASPVPTDRTTGLFVF